MIEYFSNIVYLETRELAEFCELPYFNISLIVRIERLFQKK